MINRIDEVRARELALAVIDARDAASASLHTAYIHEPRDNTFLINSEPTHRGAPGPICVRPEGVVSFYVPSRGHYVTFDDGSDGENPGQSG